LGPGVFSEMRRQGLLLQIGILPPSRVFEHQRDARALTQVASATRLVRLDANANQHAPSPGSRTALEGVRPRSSEWGKRRIAGSERNASVLEGYQPFPPEGGQKSPWNSFQGSSVLNRPIPLPDSSGSNNTTFKHGQPERFVDAAVASNFLCCSRKHLLHLARTGQVPAHPFGGGSRKSWLFRLSELAAFVLQSNGNSSKMGAGRSSETETR
jgi:hypothetical protein